jgi:DNA-binding CsgD family transcriptional regulator
MSPHLDHATPSARTVTTASTVTAPTSPTRHTLVRLQREWGRLNRSPRALSAARSWSLCIEHFASLDDLLVASGFGQVARAADHDDALLGDLLAAARHHPLAARVVLQRLLPGLSAIARRNTPVGTELVGSIDDLLAAAWTVIRTYPIDRRPTFVVAGLLRDCEYHAFRRHRRRKAVFVPVPNERFADSAATETDDAGTELRRLLDDAARAGMSADDLVLARRLAEGTTTAQLAAEAQVTERTIRNHRAAMLYRLRTIALATA